MNGPLRPEDLGVYPTTREFSPGQKVFAEREGREGRFELIRKVGRGGMGVVWQAYDHRLKDEVALKFLVDTVKFSPEALHDLKRETARSQKLTHPHIVRVHDLQEDDNWAAISMEFIDGDNLSAIKIARPSRCFEVNEIAPWVEQLIGALEYAHIKPKVIHRDLKPSNLMITKDGELKIADFGIARTLVDATRGVSSTHGSSGTAAYMSPQQAQGHRASISDDVYSLGATLYDLLSGKPPFHGGVDEHQLGVLVPPSIAQRRRELETGSAEVPLAWERTVAACLSIDPARRPASAGEVGRLLFGSAVTAVHFQGQPVPAGNIRLPAPRTEKPHESTQRDPEVDRNLRPVPGAYPLEPPEESVPSGTRWGSRIGVGAAAAVLIAGAAYWSTQPSHKSSTDSPKSDASVAASAPSPAPAPAAPSTPVSAPVAKPTPAPPPLAVANANVQLPSIFTASAQPQKLSMSLTSTPAPAPAPSPAAQAQNSGAAAASTNPATEKGFQAGDYVCRAGGMGDLSVTGPFPADDGRQTWVYTGMLNGTWTTGPAAGHPQLTALPEGTQLPKGWTYGQSTQGNLIAVRQMGDQLVFTEPRSIRDQWNDTQYVIQGAPQIIFQKKPPPAQ